MELDAQRRGSVKSHMQAQELIQFHQADVHLTTPASSLRTQFMPRPGLPCRYADCVIVQVVCRRPLVAEVRAQSPASACGICGWQSGTGGRFSPSTSILPRQYHSTSASYLFIKVM